MPKSAGAKASEKRRLARIKEEKRAAGGGGEEFDPAGGAYAQGQIPGAPPSMNRLAAEIRRLCDAGEPLQAKEVFDQTVGHNIDKTIIDNTVAPVLRALVQSGECAVATQMVQAMRERSCGLDLKQVSQVLVCISQRCSASEVKELMAEMRVMLMESVSDFISRGSAVYFGFFADLLLRDFMAEVQSGLDRLRGGNVDWLARMGYCMQQATVTSQNGWNVEFAGRLPVSSHSWQKADTVVAMPLGWTWASGTQTWLEGCITEVRGSGFSMRVYPGEAMRQGLVKPKTCWRVDKIANKVVLDRQIQAMRVLCAGPDGGPNAVYRTASPSIRKIIMSEASSWSENMPEDQVPDAEEPGLCAQPPDQLPRVAGVQTEFFGRLNQSQQWAVQSALVRQVTLVQGPPGTGKTHMACGLIEQWARCGVKPVLAVCDSNAGVENIYAGLMALGLNCVRVGRPESGKAAEFSFLSGGMSPMGQTALGGQSKDRDSFFAQQKKAMKSADVVCCTCAGAGSDTLEKHSFQAILVDEASQSTEPSVIVPICKGSCAMALVGDHEQLPATVLNQESRDLGLERSLFDRLQARGVEPQFLDIQYRMHPALSAFPSLATYGGRITSGVFKESRPCPHGFDWPLPEVPIAFVPVKRGMEQQVGSSFRNEMEANALSFLVKKLCAPGDLQGHEIGVITPYQEQCQLLKRMLPMGVECSSVDGFQGREKEVILVSTVRANDAGKLGFVTDRRRTNVTLTRARRGLIVVGHPTSLEKDTEGLWGMWLEFAVSRGLVVGDTTGAEPDLMQELAKLDKGGSLSFVSRGESEAKRRRLDAGQAVPGGAAGSMGSMGSMGSS